jgi:hypothetical protein
VRRSMVMRSRATDGRSASECQGNGQIRPSNAPFGTPGMPGAGPPPRVWAFRQSRKSIPSTPLREPSGVSRRRLGAQGSGPGGRPAGGQVTLGQSVRSRP